jgi:hypothetical protein
MSASLPEQLAEYSAYDLYGPHHANGAWTSAPRRTHVAKSVAHTTHMALEVENKRKAGVEKC